MHQVGALHGHESVSSWVLGAVHRMEGDLLHKYQHAAWCICVIGSLICKLVDVQCRSMTCSHATWKGECFARSWNDCVRVGRKALGL